MNDILVRGARIAYHLIGLETTVSILSAGLLQEPTGCPYAFVADVAGAAKRDLPAGASLDGEGGHTVYGALVAADRSVADRLLRSGSAAGWSFGAQSDAGSLSRSTTSNPPRPAERSSSGRR